MTWLEVVGAWNQKKTRDRTETIGNTFPVVRHHLHFLRHGAHQRDLPQRLPGGVVGCVLASLCCFYCIKVIWSNLCIVLHLFHPHDGFRVRQPRPQLYVLCLVLVCFAFFVFSFWVWLDFFFSAKRQKSCIFFLKGCLCLPFFQPAKPQRHIGEARESP